MINLYHTNQDILLMMKKNQFEDVQLKIITSSQNKKKYIFLKKSDSSFDWESLSSGFANLFFKEKTEWIKGAEVKSYFDQAVYFHSKLRRAIKKASYLGKGCLTIEQQGYTPCFMDTTYYPEMISSHHLGMPFYRRLQQLYKNFIKNSLASLEFEQWLTTESGNEAIKEVAEKDQASIKDLQITRLTKTTRTAFRVNFVLGENGAKIHYNGQPLDTRTFSTITGPGKAIFVIGCDGYMYIGSHDIGRFHHSSFFAGQPVVCAGEIITDSEGKLIEITDKSGHYNPKNPHLLNALYFLEKQGINLDAVTLVKGPKKLMRDAHGIYSGRFSAVDFLRKKGNSEASPLLDKDFS